MKTLLLSCWFVLSIGVDAVDVFELGADRFSERPGGKEADSIVGDFVLRSDTIEAVVSGDLPLRRANMGAFYGDGNHSPGCLYDLTLRGEDNDQLTVFSPCVQKGDVTHVRALPDEGAIEVLITAQTSGLNYDVVHRYRLEDGWNGILITTEFRNHSKEPVTHNIYDHWTQMRVQGSIKGIRWADAIDPADKAGYAFSWVAEDGAILPDSRIVESSNRRIAFRVEGEETVKIARFIAVGTSPVEAIGRVAARRSPLNVAPVRWKVESEDDSPLNNVTLEFPVENGKTPSAYLEAGSDEFNFSWFLGTHPVRIVDTGRDSIEESMTLEAQQPFSRTTAMSPMSRVSFSVREKGESIPCKVQFLPRKGTPKVDLGPTDRAHGCVDQWHSETGDFLVPLPPGEYVVVVTRGPEYSRVSQLIDLEPGETETIRADLERVVDTRGWVSADFHNHSTPSGDNTCGTPDRIINLAAEQVEFVPTTEHNRLYDWAPTIEALGLGRFLKTIPGIELTGRGPHLNAFPFEPDPMKQDGGAPVWNPDPRISAMLLDNLQKRDPDRWIQVNHPDMSENFIDRNLDGEADGGFLHLGRFINGLETQNYRGSQILSKAPFSVGRVNNGLGKRVNYYREFIWLQLLNQGLRVWGVGVADAHHVYGNGVGSWRVYIPSSTDDPSEVDWRELSRNAMEGKMVLSSGPYLEVSTEKGTIAGGEEVSNGRVLLKVRVQCPEWMGLDRVQVLVNGRQDERYNFTTENHSDHFREGIIRFDETLSLELEEDAHLIVVAAGEKFDLTPLYGTSTQAGNRPCAYNNPIFIDIDGDGFQANGDNLGFELPVGKLSVQKVETLLGL